MLVAQGTNKQVRRLNSLQNTCKTLVSALSYDMGIPQQLTLEANSAKQDPWLWVYDNFNVHNKTRHERRDNHVCRF